MTRGQGPAEVPDRDLIRLDVGDLPRCWYNLSADLPVPLPSPVDPAAGPSRLERLRGLRPPVLVEQDEGDASWIDMPKAVRAHLAALGRPTPLLRARRLERALATPARIYLKREDMLPTGSFKLNSAVAQAQAAHDAGFKGLVSETGAGQWGAALALAGALYGLDCTVFMARVSYGQKPGRVTMMRTFGAAVFPSPGEATAIGRRLLSGHPDHPGSIGTAIAEAIETASGQESAAYVSGSNLPGVLLHQTVIGQETQRQLEAVGEQADAVVACVGGGSNLGGLMFPFIGRWLAGKAALPLLLAAESTAAPRLTRGDYRFDYGDPARQTPLAKSYTLGCDYVPPPVHVGGLRQHNGSPLVGLVRHLGWLEAAAYDTPETWAAGRLLARTEGIAAAPEACHALRAVCELALEARRTGESTCIVGCISGHGLLDMEAGGEGAAPSAAAEIEGQALVPKEWLT